MKKTKAKLGISLITLIITVFVLLGSTYAWFTDSVSNTGNRIQAGTLDVDLLMYKQDEGKETYSYQSIDGGIGDIFKEAANANNSTATLWEPGKTQIVYLAVQNKGNLALKYQFYLDVTDHGLCDDGSENSSLEYIVVPGVDNTTNLSSYGTDYATIKAAVATAIPLASTADVLPGRTIVNHEGVLDEISEKGTTNETEYFALIVHMKEDAGNVYQGKDAIIDVYLTATQYTSENDGFGTNTYDAQAEYADKVEEPKVDSIKKKVVGGEDTVFISSNTPSEINTNQTKVTIPKEVVSFEEGKDTQLTLTTTSILPANTTFKVTSGEGAVASIDLKVTVNNVEVNEFKDGNGNPIDVLVETYIAKGLTLDGTTNKVDVQYAGTDGKSQPTFVSYDTTTGKLVFKTNHFSQYLIDADQTAYIEENNTAYLTLENAISAAKTNETVFLLKDIKIGVIEINKVISLDGRNYIISGKAGVGYTDGGTSNKSNLSGIRIENITDTNGTINIKNFRLTNIGNTNAICVEEKSYGVAENLHINFSNISMDHLKRVGIGVYGGTFSVDNCKFDSTYITSDTDNQIQLGDYYDGYIVKGSVTNCTFTNSITESNKWTSSGIWVGAGTNVTIDNCSFKNNSVAIATAFISSQAPADVTIKNCSIKDCERGVFVDDGYSPCAGNNRISVTLESGNNFESDEPIQIFKRYSTSKYILNITAGTYVSKQCSNNYAEWMKPFAVYDCTTDEKTVDYINVSIAGGKFIVDNVDVSSDYIGNNHLDRITYPLGYCWYSNGSWNNGNGCSDSQHYSFFDILNEGWLGGGEGVKLYRDIDLDAGITCQMTSGTFYLYLQGFSFTNGTIKLNQGVSVISDTTGISNIFSGGTITETDNGNGTYKYTCN